MNSPPFRILNHRKAKQKICLKIIWEILYLRFSILGENAYYVYEVHAMLRLRQHETNQNCYLEENCADGSGGPTCCTSSKQCEEGEGDCDSDVDCAGNLKCGQGNGLDDNCDTSLGFPSDYDCCYDPSNPFG